MHPWQWVCVAPQLMLAMLALANGDGIRHGETLFSIAKCDADHTRIAEHFATVAFRKASEPSMQGSLWIVARIMWNYVESKGLSCCLCVVLTWQGLHNWEGNDGPQTSKMAEYSTGSWLRQHSRESSKAGLTELGGQKLQVLMVYHGCVSNPIILNMNGINTHP